MKNLKERKKWEENEKIRREDMEKKIKEEWEERQKKEKEEKEKEEKRKNQQVKITKGYVEMRKDDSDGVIRYKYCMMVLFSRIHCLSRLQLMKTRKEKNHGITL